MNKKAIIKTLTDLAALVKKLRKKIKTFKTTEFVITINGEEYRTENEIQEAYGCGIISNTQRRNALLKLGKHSRNEDVEILQREIYYLTLCYDSLLDLLEKEEL